MLAHQVRSGLVETVHDGAVAVVGPDGDLLAAHGDIDRVFFLRSSAKPFQALVAQESGAGLDPLELAMACASHRGFPAHIALVESMLARVDLDESHLLCPPDWPLSPVAARLAEANTPSEKRRIWHNCSGKHAGFLRACVANGWPIDSYLDPDHPLQEKIVDLVDEIGGYASEPVGVDGCGAPVHRTTTRVMAHMFARLGSDPRFGDVYEVMHRYPALVGGNGEGDTEMAIAANAVAKGGAAGCVGVGVKGRHGIGAKSWEGSPLIANLAASRALEQMGDLSATALRALGPISSPPVSGGGAQVGTIDGVFTLDRP